MLYETMASVDSLGGFHFFPLHHLTYMEIRLKIFHETILGLKTAAIAE